MSDGTKMSILANGTFFGFARVEQYFSAPRVARRMQARASHVVWFFGWADVLQVVIRAYKRELLAPLIFPPVK